MSSLMIYVIQNKENKNKNELSFVDGEKKKSNYFIYCQYIINYFVLYGKYDKRSGAK